MFLNMKNPTLIFNAVLKQQTGLACLNEDRAAICNLKAKDGD